MKYVLGVDPGMGGALCLLNKENGYLIESMPRIGKQLDLGALAGWIRAHKDSIERAFIEQVSARPGQGVSTMFKFGRAYGSVEGVIAALGIPYELVTPQRWTKVMHAGIEGGQTAKERSMLAAARLYPMVGLIPPGCRVPDSGLVDSLLIAGYGLRQIGAA